MWVEIQAVRAAKTRWDEEGDTMRVRACELLEEGLWDTFPSFCNWATDVAEMKGLAKRMGEWLGSEEWGYAHPIVCKGLTLLITQNEEVVKAHEGKVKEEEEDEDTAEAKRVFDEEDDDDVSHSQPPPKKKEKAPVSVRYPYDVTQVGVEVARENLSTLSSYAKNFLPLLFNLVSRGECHRDVVLTCIEAYAAISDGATINSLFKRALKKMLEANAAALANTADEAERTKAHALADIVLAMTAVLDDDNLSFLYRSLLPSLSSGDAITQKKAYKLLAAICRHHNDFFGQHWQEILTAVTAATPSLLPSAAKVRLSCLTALCLPIPMLVVRHGEDAGVLLGHLPALLGEVLLALKEPSFKTRHAAYQFINEMGAAMREGDGAVVREGREEEVKGWGLTSPASPHPLFHEYVYMLMGGLAGTSPHMQSATVMAFSHLLFSCRGVPGVLTPSLLSTFLPLLSSKAREVQKAMMGLCKVMALCLPPDEIRQYARAIIEGLGVWGEDRRTRFQEKIRAILDLLMRKVGVEEVRGMVGKDQLRLVEHIRKMKAREARAKTEAWAKRKGEREGREGEKEGEGGTLRKVDFDAALLGSEEDEEEVKEERVKGKKKERSRESGYSMREGTEDLLGKDMILNVGKVEEVGEEREEGGKRKKKREVRENAEGKLLVMEEDGGEDDEGESEGEGHEEGKRGKKRTRG